MVLCIFLSVLFVQATSVLSHEIVHSLRASNAAFASTVQDEGYWSCKEYCVDTNTHGWTENVCESECDLMTAEQRQCISTCQQDAQPDILPWDDCNCDCTGHCWQKGPGLVHSSIPTVIYTRPPVSSPSSPSSDYDFVE